ncbi:MAG: molybdopterin-guanine dinucleotide biosynthesis protein B [Desulfotignum sp.]|nr:molybdopterin-guanine dinucleotide biosynthesis protein B [Desulfotignum sp.]MCF8126199.1 molybdopterin-guanine dinucleotide biosynthesis protein B [Desulfotignum sp.]
MTHPVQIIGHPGCGKTTLMVELIEALVQRDIRVGSIKHSAHSHELDKPGKDSFCHRKAGAVPAAMMTPDMAAVFLPRDSYMSLDDLIRQYYASVDMVLIEGWISGPHEKIEVFGNGCDRTPLFHQVPNVKVFVTDQPVSSADRSAAAERQITVFNRSDIGAIAQFIISGCMQD